MIKLRRPEPSEVYMNFGRHKGERVTEVPRDYLWWIVTNIPDHMSPTVARAVSDAILMDM